MTTHQKHALHEIAPLRCGSGKRTAMALTRYGAAGVHIDTHLAGGIAAWKAAGLPTVTLDPGTGVAVDRQ